MESAGPSHKLTQAESKNKRSKKMFLVCKNIIESDFCEKYTISFPKSRIDRSNGSFSLEAQSTFSDSWQARVQSEYNACPVGPYAGPYDQAASVPLSAQLPDSNLSYDKYTQFQHDSNVDCMEYAYSCIYDAFDDLEKIKVLGPVKIVSSNEGPTKIDNDYKKKIHYTCVSLRCKIPCPCKDCCNGEGQCKEHKIGHPHLFNKELHAISIRGSDFSCQNSFFFEQSYVNEYSEIPITCGPCNRDVLHHNAYHIDYHFHCKFCIQNHHKTKPTTERELLHEIRE